MSEALEEDSTVVKKHRRCSRDCHYGYASSTKHGNAVDDATQAFPRCHHDTSSPDGLNQARGSSGAMPSIDKPPLQLDIPPPPPPHPSAAASLPTVCPGCGAHAQTLDPSSAGYYDLAKLHNTAKRRNAEQDEDALFHAALQRDPALNSHDAFTSPPPTQPHLTLQQSQEAPICARCHDLRYQSRGSSIVHPSMQSIQRIIEESPHKHNHIYHVLDAADFPLSLIPNLTSSLQLPKLRTRNRRSKHISYSHNRTAQVSFIITRSDLLAPKKEQVDALLPYLRDVLRDALGRRDKGVRLGNVRCVSAKRGWWTKTVKEEVWEQRGGAWMVGKVNVGKSALVEVVYPKGRGGQEVAVVERVSEEVEAGKGEMAMEGSMPFHAMSTANSPGELAEGLSEPARMMRKPEMLDDPDEEAFAEEDNDALSLLPPAQPETQYPAMPLVSSLPGTTASPIRIPYGNGKGELIDLPGVHRSSLDMFIKPEYHKDLVMQGRVVPEQYTIRSGQSLLLGGLIRITPRLGEDEVMLAYPFVPEGAMKAHITGTHKALAIQTGIHSSSSLGREGQAYEGNVASIATDTAKAVIRSAGTYRLEWDVTKRRSGPLTDITAGKQKAANLPFVIYSADILIEGVGWVELVCQVRRRRPLDALSGLEERSDEGGRGMEMGVPEVEVFSPEGKFVGLRRPMGAWLLGGKRHVPVGKRRARPRMSIGMVKRRRVGTA